VRLGITPLTASFLEKALRRFTSETQVNQITKQREEKWASSAPDPASLAGTSTRHASVSDLHETRVHRLSTMNHAGEDATQSASVFLLPSRQITPKQFALKMVRQESIVSQPRSISGRTPELCQNELAAQAARPTRVAVRPRRTACAVPLQTRGRVSSKQD